ncbi:hypothetical protein Taro_036140, partial [Colocasia esculenta]|nr:hypothetical protein [Colocasia esculenta]
MDRGRPLPLLLLVILLHVVALSRLAVVTTAMRSGRCRIFNFGDSNSDTGGLKASVGFPMGPPHGYLFFGRSTGRWSDGRLYIDFLCRPRVADELPESLHGGLGIGFHVWGKFCGGGCKDPTKGSARYLTTEEGFEKAIYSIDIGQNDISTAFYSNFTYAQVIDSIPLVLSEIESAIQ